ncbi:thymidylate kinase [Artomyces pyxidatus]|uniref:Thymidylate kinase n=1 Tax=Artomyces pyxidatus TaxID=48021 RepID=A0ACB8T5F2_9AGAM|nr:thymidylate kinase [Artomyces pyxidatus]
MLRGAFIVIEGLDRSGKSTQAAMLVSRLEGANVPVKLQKFPDRTTPIGKMIDAYLRSESDLDDHTIHLLFSANRWELAAQLEETLKAGITVLCDRYAFSGIAFSASKGLPYEWCRAPDRSLPAPDLTIFLDIAPEKAMERGGYGDERYEKEEMQRKVRELFRRMEEEITKDTHGVVGAWTTIDASQDKEAVAQDIWQVVEPLTDGCSNVIRRLWQQSPIP